MISALAAAIASTEPRSSTCTGPTLVITATSGAAIAQSSAIWPTPRMAISSTRTSVPGGAASTASGRPISVLKFSGLAWTSAGRIARQTSFTDVLPVDPVIPTTRAPSSSRQARASDWSAARGSLAPRIQLSPSAAPTRRCAASSRPHCAPTRIPQAPASRAAAPNSPPSARSPGRPTNRSPSRTSLESITTRCGPSAPPLARTSAPAAEARRSPSKAINLRSPS